jgi:hypothetical protein
LREFVEELSKGGMDSKVMAAKSKTAMVEERDLGLWENVPDKVRQSSRLNNSHETDQK